MKEIWMKWHSIVIYLYLVFDDFPWLSGYRKDKAEGDKDKKNDFQLSVNKPLLNFNSPASSFAASVESLLATRPSNMAKKSGSKTEVAFSIFVSKMLVSLFCRSLQYHFNLPASVKLTLYIFDYQGATTSSALSKLTNRLNFLKEQSLQPPDKPKTSDGQNNTDREKSESSSSSSSSAPEKSRNKVSPRTTTR